MTDDLSTAKEAWDGCLHDDCDEFYGELCLTKWPTDRARWCHHCDSNASAVAYIAALASRVEQLERENERLIANCRHGQQRVDAERGLVICDNCGTEEPIPSGSMRRARR